MRNNSWLFILALIYSNGIYSCTCRLLVKSFENCDSSANYACKHNVTFTTIGNQYYLDGVVILTRPLDNSIRTNISIEMLIGKRYVYLSSIREAKSCVALHKYLGEFAYDVERAGRIIPGICPIQKGRYQWHHYPVHFEKIATITSFPFGNLRFTAMAHDENNDVYTCIEFVVEHYT